MEQHTRYVKLLHKANKTMDGGGVKINRSIGSPGLSMVDPFLLLDEFSSDNPDDYIAGFPSHPHRGLETVTYIIDGKLRHEDSAGNSGELSSGSVQWMTAGKGVIHSEMPIQKNGLMRGFQLWLNLPKSQKMMNPRYQNLEPSDIPIVKNKNFEIKVIAGSYLDTQGPVKDVITDPIYLDVKLFPETTMEHIISEDHTVIAYVFEGIADFGQGIVEKGNLVVFSEGNRIVVKSGTNGARYLLIAAKPLNEPVARSGPFVMNTPEEIQQAFRDYSSGNLA